MKPIEIGPCVWLYRPAKGAWPKKTQAYSVRVGPNRDHRFFYFDTEKEARAFARRAVAVYRLGVIHGSQVGETK